MGARQIVTDARPGETRAELRRRALAELGDEAGHVIDFEFIGDPPVACAITVKGSRWRFDALGDDARRDETAG
jgi:hypothetical protein